MTTKNDQQPIDVENHETGVKNDSVTPKNDMEEKGKEELDVQAKFESELNEQKEKYLRLYADFDNFKKRSLKEKIELIRNASEDIIRELLVILDDFDRAKKLSETQDKEDIFPEGMKLVHHKLLGILQSKGLEAMESDGQKFDAEFHEAITEIQSPDDSKKGLVLDTIEKGYLLNKKIIRFAKVVVAK